MSLLHSPRLRRISSRIANLRDRLSGKSRTLQQRKPRRLVLDPLEERQLLAVSPADLFDNVVNQYTGTATQGTISAQSVAVDDNGDFVVAWTRYDEVFNQDGTRATDPVTGGLMYDANIYARYFTDEVQRIRLPDQLAEDSNGDGLGGSFKLVYGGNEVQKLSITATYEPFTSFQSTISGSTVLGFDVNGDGIVGAGETTTFIFNETTNFTQTAGNLQTQLRGLGGALTDVKVTGINPHEFLIEFGDISGGLNQPQITVESSTFTSGFLPSVTVETLREPRELGPFLVSATNPNQTANGIEQIFFGTSTNTSIAATVTGPAVPNLSGPRNSPTDVRMPAPGVSVTPVRELVDGVWVDSLTTFDITFNGGTGATETDAGKKDHPELVVSWAADELGNTSDGGGDFAAMAEVNTLKEPSPEFRVNPPEPDDPFTRYPDGSPRPDKYHQTNPAVAMDSDGEFVITWVSQIPDSVDHNSITDIFARRFAPAGLVENPTFFVDMDLDPVAADQETPIQGVIALDNGFRVNTVTTGPQGQPAVAMDARGNFTIAWASNAQNESFFNSVHARRYHRDGTPLGQQFLVNTYDTTEHFDPAVGMSDDGERLVISWNNEATIRARMYDGNGQLLTTLSPGGGFASAIAFDTGNNFIITREGRFDSDNIPVAAGFDWGVQAVMYNENGGVIRPNFRINSASFNTGSTPLWPNNQYGAQAGLDADGDLVVVYEGFGPDMADDTGIFGSTFNRILSRPENADLLAFVPGTVFNSGDVDATIDAVLINATNLGATDEQLGRIRAIYNAVGGLLRGEAWGVMYSSFDADPLDSILNILDSDSVVNANRDGSNQRYILTIPTSSTGGSFNIRMTHPSVGGFEQITFNPTYTNQTLNVGQTRENLEAALRGMARTGVNWPYSTFEGPVSVRVIQNGFGTFSQEVTNRIGTPWDLITRGVSSTEAVFEITFQGEVHDTAVGLSWNTNNLSAQNVPEVQIWSFSATSQGWYRFVFGSATSQDVYFDSSDLAGSANRIRTELEAVLGVTGITVSVLPGGPPYQFQVTYGGAAAGVNQPEPRQIPPQTTIDVYPGVLAPTTTQTGSASSSPPPDIFVHTYADTGTRQTGASIGMERDGDFTIVWTQHDRYTSGGTSNQTIFYRRFNDDKDTAGPIVTDVGFHNRELVQDGESVEGPVTHMVLTFDEPLLTIGADSVFNPENYRIFKNGVEVDGGVVAIEYGMNRAADLAYNPDTGLAYIDPATGGFYDVNPTPTNKYEAVLTLDGDPLTPGVQPLSAGTYVIEALAPVDPTPTSLGESGLRDKSSNPLGYTGFEPLGVDFSQTFVVRQAPTGGNGDKEVTDATQQGAKGRFFPESAKAVGVDADGDYVVAWTAADGGVDRVYYRLFNADGTPAVDLFGNPIPVREVTAGDGNSPSFAFDDQRYANVAVDADGYFVVTWTNYRGTGDARDADIYARRFDSTGDPLGDSFRVNTYGAGELDLNDPTRSNQKFSSVAIDVDGDFVITWASYAQESAGRLGTGYGVYAKKYDSQISYDNQNNVLPPRQAIAEFQVNSTTGGNQTMPSVDMDAHGNFVITWASDQGGLGTDIVARAFTAAGAPIPISAGLGVTGWQAGEILVNQTTDGNQLYPTVAMDLGGSSFVVTWSSSGQDGSGWGVYARTFAIPKTITDPFVGLIVPSSSEFRVNTTTTANQIYSSVAMDHQGDFVVVWSGFGDQFGQEDLSGFGVFYQRYNAGAIPVGGETRVNQTTAGNQWLPSVDMDGEGNFVAVWQGSDATGEGGVYIFDSVLVDAQIDNDPPIVTDVVRGLSGGDRERVFEGAVLETNTIDRLTVIFGERLSVAGGTSGFTSVTNPLNWSLEKDGAEIVGGILGIQFAYNAETRKYEAVVHFDGNGLLPGQPRLDPGAYTLTATSAITDGLNQLDGNYNGLPGSDPEQGYRLNFFVADNATNGPEFRVNEETRYLQEVSTTMGTGFAREENKRAVAVDHDGDFVVVWTSHGQDDPNDPTGAGVYMRMYDRNDQPLTGEILVNTTTMGHQRNASVAMDADGDFVIVWEARNVDGTTGDIGDHPDGSWGVYARRFDATGAPLGEEFLVNTETLGDQWNPAVAMDSYGNFAITWVHTHGQNFSFFHDVRVQRYNVAGERIGTEFQANSRDVPGVPGRGRLPAGGGGTEVNPQVALDDEGNLVVVWELVTLYNDGAWSDQIIVGRLFDADSAPRVNAWTSTTDEFQISPDTIEGQPAPAFGDFRSDPEHREHQSPVDVIGPNDIRRTARNPQVAMDDQGRFYVVWESFQDNDIDEDDDTQGDSPSQDNDDWPDSYGIYFRQFTSNGSPMTYFNANMVNTLAGGVDPNFAFAQVNPSIAIDADGDLAVVWNGNGAEPREFNSSDPRQVVNHDSEGIWIRWWHAGGDGRSINYVTQQKRVNFTEGGVQHFPSIAMQPDGSSVVVWSGAGVGDTDGIFARRYDSAVDNAGPRTYEMWQLRADGARQRVTGAEELDSVRQLIVVFDEAMWTSGDDRVTNPANWRLLSGGEEMVDVIDTITFGLNPSTNKWEAVVTFIEALPEGNYELRALTPIRDQAQSGLRDAIGNPLARTGLAPNGLDQSHFFSVSGVEEGDENGDGRKTDMAIGLGTTFPETRRAVASDADGDQVAVWTGANGQVYVGMYDADGRPAPTRPAPFLVYEGSSNAPEFAGDGQRHATVAADADGDFVVTWTNYDATTGDADIYLRRFNADGSAAGDAVRVNAYGASGSPTQSNQKWPVVAMEPDGDFIVTWSSYAQENNGQPGSGYGVYARRYSASGLSLVSEFQVNVTTEGDQMRSSVAVDSSGGFVIVWESNQNGVGKDIVARSFWPDGSPQAFGGDLGYLYGEFIVNQTTNGDQTQPDVAMRDDGSSYVVVWTSPDGSQTGIFGREMGRITAATEASRALFAAEVPATGLSIPHVTNPPVDTTTAQAVVSNIDVTGNFTIADLDVRVNIQHPRVSDLTLELTHPSGASIVLAQRVPRDPTQTPPELLGADFAGTIFDDEAIVAIDQYPQAQPPFTGHYSPAPGALAQFDGLPAQGTWTLTIYDSVAGPYEPRLDPDDPQVPLQAFLNGWSLDIGIGLQASVEFKVSTSTTGTQANPSIAASSTGDYVVVWSGVGNQPGQEDLSNQGVFYQRFGLGGAKVGTETRVNRIVDGRQWIPSVASDVDGNFVVVWTGPSATALTTEVYKYTSTDISIQDTHGPTVTEVQTSDGRKLKEGGVVGPITELIVSFSEDLSIREVDVAGAGRADYELALPRMPIEGGAGVRNGEWFRVRDRRGTEVQFEFDTGDGQIAAGSHVMISVNNFTDTQATVAAKVVAAIDGSGLVDVIARAETGTGVASVIVNDTRDVRLSSGAAVQLNRLARQELVIPWMPVEQGPGILDGERFTVRSPLGYQVTFEFDKNGTVQPDSDVILAVDDLFDTRLTIAQKVADAINAAGTLVNVTAYVDDDGVVSVVIEGAADVRQSFNAKLTLNRLYDGPGPDSVLNPDNWALLKNGTVIADAIVGVSFQRGPSRKYQAVVQLDGNGLLGGVTPLSEGNYTLVVYDTIQDKYSFRLDSPFSLGNALDGDFDGIPGTDLAVSAVPGYSLNFTVAATGDRIGPEFRISEDTKWQKTFAQPLGTGYGKEQTTRTVVVDNDGDFAVVWTSYGQDDPSDPNGAGVYLRLFDRNDVPLTGEILVNTVTQGDQRNPSIAMDADGDLVVVWESKGDNVDGSWGIFGRRFNSVGTPLGDQFRVNTHTQNDQLNPAVSMDEFGNFVVVWASKGQSYSYFNDVRGQVYNHRGERVTSEFRVNEANIPGTQTLPGSIELNPTVAMDITGNFVVAWELAVAQNDGVALESDIYARVFDALANPTTGEFQVNDGSSSFLADPEHNPREDAGAGGDLFRRARNPQATMDGDGNFIIVWEAFQDNDLDAASGPDSYGIYFRRFQPDGTPDMGSDHQANLVITTDDLTVLDSSINSDRFGYSQVNPSIAMDVDGDYAVVWNGNGAVPHPLDPRGQSVTNADNEGVWIRKFHTDAGGGTEFVSTQSRVNMTSAGIQQFPSIGMTPSGDMVVVWSGTGVGDQYGIFARRYLDPTDTAGPRVSDVLDSEGQRIELGAQLTGEVAQITVVFDEEMMTTGPNSVTNPNNYRILKNGAVAGVSIHSITFGLNPATNKWEAVLTLDGDPRTLEPDPLEEGQYELVIVNTLRDVVGNPLASTGRNPNGANFATTFNVATVIGTGTGEMLVNDTVDGDQYTRTLVPDGPESSPRAVAADDDGEYVVVWTDSTPGQEGVYAKVYNDLRWFNIPAGNPVLPAGRMSAGPQPDANIRVTDNPTAEYASVARDADGDFVVTWSQNDGTKNVPDWNVYARRYDATGRPFGGAFLVNTETDFAQRYPAVAVDVDGDFVITWQSQDQDGSGYGIYAQRYSPAGLPIGGVDEVQLLSFVGNPTGTFSLRWDGDNDPATPNVTAPITFTGNTFDVVAEVEARLNELAGNVNRLRATAISLNQILIQFVGVGGSKDQAQIQVNPAGTNLVGDPGAGLVITTELEGRTGEFRVNDTTENDQVWPSIAMDADGRFVISWTSFGQDGDAPQHSNVYAKQFVSNTAFYTSGGGVSRPYAWETVLRSQPDAKWQVSTGDPDDYLVPAGMGYDGVVQINIPGVGYGSGTLLSSGQHILTAAHVVDMAGGVPWPFVDVAFDVPGGRMTMTATQIFIHPDWNGDIFGGSDLAMIVLPEQAPAIVERYDIYRGSDELGQIATMVGYGAAGQGEELVFDELKRRTQNVFEVYGDAFNGQSTSDYYLGPGTFNVPVGNILVYDFDSGLAANDTFGLVFGLKDLGLGHAEGSSAHGDSGGPAFIKSRIAGVTSGGMEHVSTDSDAIPFNVSFGTTGWFTRVSYFADWIDSLTESSGAEFLVNDTIANDQKWSSVAMDADGDFVITWTSYGQDGVGDGYGSGYDGQQGVFAKRYHADGTEVDIVDPVTGLPVATDPDRLDPITGLPLPINEFQVNTSRDGNQQRSQVSMDADGDFTIVWESSLAPSTVGSYDIYAQRYVANYKMGTSPYQGVYGQLGGEMAINRTRAGDQRSPSVALNDTGDAVFVWSGYGEQPYADRSDTQGVFHLRTEKSKDDAGPVIADVLQVFDDGGTFSLERVTNGAELPNVVTQFLVSFGEDLFAENDYALESILTRGNWALYQNGRPLSGAIAAVEFGLNQTSKTSPAILPGETNKYEAIVTFDGDPNVPGNQPLPPGRYTLAIRDTVEDLFGNRLDGNYDGTPGGDFNREFVVLGSIDDDPDSPTDPTEDDEDDQVNVNEAGNQIDPAVAANDAGDYVIVWVENNDIVGRRYDRYGSPRGAQFVVNTYRDGIQGEPDVAMDRHGNFVVTWSGVGERDQVGRLDEVGIFARVYDAFGVPLGDQFHVNQYHLNAQNEPSVGMSGSGDFVISWTSYGQDGDVDGVFARQFRFNGEAKGDEFQVNSHWNNRQDRSDVGMDNNGNFVVVWAAYRHPADDNEWGIFGQRFNAAGAKLGGEFLVNTSTSDDQMEPAVAVDPVGNFVVTWASFGQDGSGWGVYARRFNAAGTALDANAFRVNQTTLNWQYQPDVSMDNSGNFVVTWAADAQDNPGLADLGVYARAYRADGTARFPGQGEFRVNANIEGHQFRPAVALDADGDFVIVWMGPDADGYGIYQRLHPVNVPPREDQGTSVDVGVGGGSYYAGDSASTVVTPATLDLRGTAGNDVFEVIAGTTLANSIVKINGVVQTIGPNTNLLRFDGLGGTDTVIFTGSPNDEAVVMRPGYGQFTTSRYGVQASNVAYVTAHGGGGNDVARLYDNPKAIDYLYATPAETTLSGSGYKLAVVDYPTVYAYGTPGHGDKARLYDDPHTDDTFVGKPAYGQLSGEGFFYRATSFDTVLAYATPGGNDTAYLYDDPNAQDTLVAKTTYANFGNNWATSFRNVYGYGTKGNQDTALLYADPSTPDVFVGNVASSTLYGSNFSFRATGFDQVTAFGNAGNGDVARLYDKAGAKDTLVARPRDTVLSGSGFSNRAAGFDSIFAYATPGDGDVAKMYDDPSRKDTFVGKPLDSAFSGPAFYNRAIGFDSVSAYATAGNKDFARLYGRESSPDTYVAKPDYGSMTGDGYYTYAASFGSIYGYGTKGEGDVAWLYDRAGSPDALVGKPTYAQMYGTGYVHQAVSFDQVYAYATKGDGDSARLYGLAGKPDVFTGSPTAAALYGEGFFNRAAGFDSTYGYGTAGDKDVAKLYDDPNGADTYVGKPGDSYLYGSGFFNRVKSFDLVYAYATAGSGDQAILLDDPNRKDTFLATPTYSVFQGETFYTRATNFSYVRATATKTSHDRAILLDSALDEYADLLAASNNWAYIKNEGLDYLNLVRDFEEVEAHSSNPSDTRNINADALDYVLKMELDW